MDIIVETDCGQDPDDFFTLCYLVAAGVNIKAITIHPGNPDQIAIAKFFCKEVGLDIPIGASKYQPEKRSSGGMHYSLLDRYNFPKTAKPDGYGLDVIKSTFTSDTELFIIGPVSSIGKFCVDHEIKRATMQGGFLPYTRYQPTIYLPKFAGHDYFPTFNFNGDRPGALNFIDAKIADKSFVGKNVCHGIVYAKSDYTKQAKPRDRASELFMEAMDIYLSYHDEKKFHDPTAAVCHLHPEIGTWIRGKPIKIKNGWSTEIREDGDKVLGDIDRDKLWEYIYNWR